MVFVNTEFFVTLPVDAATQVLQGVVNEAIQSHGDSGALRRSFEEAIRATAALQEVSPVPPPGLRPPGGSAVAGPSLQVGRAPAPAPQQLPHIPILGRTAGGDGEDGDGSFGSRPDDGSGAIPANASFLCTFRSGTWERPRRPAGEGDDGSGSQGIAHSLLQLATAQANGASGGLGAEAGAEREDAVEEKEGEGGAGDAMDVGEGGAGDAMDVGEGASGGLGAGGDIPREMMLKESESESESDEDAASVLNPTQFNALKAYRAVRQEEMDGAQANDPEASNSEEEEEREVQPFGCHCAGTHTEPYWIECMGCNKMVETSQNCIGYTKEDAEQRIREAEADESGNLEIWRCRICAEQIRIRAEEAEMEAEEESESESVEEDGAQAGQVAQDDAEFGNGGGNESWPEPDASADEEANDDADADPDADADADADADVDGEEDDDGSLALEEEEGDEDEEADGDEDDDDGDWQYDANRYATADAELQRVVAEGIGMEGFSSFEDLGYSKYSPRTRSGNVPGVYLSVHEEVDGSYLVKIGKGTKRKGQRRKSKGPLDERLYCAQTYRGSYGMVKAYKAPRGDLGELVPALEKMIKIHSAAFKGEENTGTESFRMPNKAQALRFLCRIDFWIQKCYDERMLTVPASATEMEGGKQICLRRQDENVSQSIFYFRNKEGLAGAGVAYNPGGPGGIRGDEKRRADKFRAFFSPLDFDKKVDYLLTDEGKRRREWKPVTAWKKAIRQEWKANRLTPPQIERLLSIPVYRDNAMKAQIEGEQVLRKKREMLGAFQATHGCPGKYPDPQATRLSDDDRKLGKEIQSCLKTWRKRIPEAAGWNNIEKFAELYRSLGIAEFERKPTRMKKRGKPTKAARGRGARVGSFYSRTEQKWMDNARARSIFTNADFAKWKEETNAPDPMPTSGFQFVYPPAGNYSRGNYSRDGIVIYQSSNQSEATRAMAKLAEDKELGDALEYNNDIGMRKSVDTDKPWNYLWIRSYRGTESGWCKGGQAEAAKKEWIKSMKQKKAAAPAKRPKSWPSGPTPTRPKRTRKETDRFEATKTIKSQATGRSRKRSKRS